MKTRIVAVAAVALALAACQDAGTKQTVGGLGGAAAGGLLGSQFGHGSGKLAMTGLGVLVGALIGSEVGKSMDEADRQRAEQARLRAQSSPIGEKIVWSNPTNGHSGSYVATREGTSTAGAYCREFQQTITVGGKTEQGFGTACRQPDGTWKIVEQ
ncbi:MAG: glycine zipper 2TM domain-containing protein [Proteobacteria bacterium]|nr:glycine zipper 2TM domain-containing protein [Pseudomonadota bacterium]MBI3497256.1 glycine zipper 2TM domain-containing protein [Pseudomonadota bacterium]